MLLQVLYSLIGSNAYHVHKNKDLYQYLGFGESEEDAKNQFFKYMFIESREISFTQGESTYYDITRREFLILIS